MFFLLLLLFTCLCEEFYGWELVYENDSQGRAIQGDVEMLKAAVTQGADIKVMMPKDPFDLNPPADQLWYQVSCHEVMTDASAVSCRFHLGTGGVPPSSGWGCKNPSSPGGGGIFQSAGSVNTFGNVSVECQIGVFPSRAGPACALNGVKAVRVRWFVRSGCNWSVQKGEIDLFEGKDCPGGWSRLRSREIPVSFDVATCRSGRNCWVHIVVCKKD